MATVFEKILYAGTAANYAALATKDATKLYFLTDTKQIYKGEDLYTDAVRKVTARPSTPATGVFYDISGTNTLEYYDGTDWVVVRPEVVGTISASSTDDQLVTAKAVYDFVQAELEELASSADTVKAVAAGTADATVIVTKGDDSSTNVTVPGVVTTPSYDATTRKITLPVSTGDALVIELGKDIFVDSTKDNKYNPETGNIELYLNDGTMISIPASSLVDTYTGGATTTATVKVGTDDNVITVDVKLSTADGNAITVDAENGGLFLSLADYAKSADVDTKVQAVADDLSALESTVNTVKSTVDVLNGDATTEGSVKKQVADLKAEVKETTDALSESVTTNTSDIDSLEERVQALEDAFGWGTF